MKIPRSIIKRKKSPEIEQKALSLGATPLQAHIIAGRLQKETPTQNVAGILAPKIADIPDLHKIQDLDKGASRIADAIENEEKIALACDFDVDGTSSAAILYKSIVDFFNHPSFMVKVYISHRMEEGYGFTLQVADRILEEGIPSTLVVTADQGSSNNDTIVYYKEQMNKLGLNGDVVISDHHEIPIKGGPKDAFAFINPQREDDKFEDKTICGATVALLLMARTREILIERGVIPNNTPKLSSLLTYSTAATISDCVSMSSSTNRAIVRRGLNDINSEAYPNWKVVKKYLAKDPAEPIRADSIGFGFGPRINACSRVGADGLSAVKFYLSENEGEAQRYLDILTGHNDERRDIEQSLLEEANRQAIELIKLGYISLVIYFPNGHHGIHGIVASRMVEKYGLPTICLSPKSEGIVSGSARSIIIFDDKGTKKELDLKEILTEIDEQEPIFIGYGGHKMAAGMSLKVEDIERLRLSIDLAVQKRLPREYARPVIETDGEINEKFLTLDRVDEILSLEPFGKGFEYPKFSIRGILKNIKMVGKTKETASLEIEVGGKLYKAIWFKFLNSDFQSEYFIGQEYTFIVEIRDNFFRENRTLNLNISYAYS